MLWTSANETRKVPPRQEIELATEMSSTETYFHFSRKKSLQSQQAPRPERRTGSRRSTRLFNSCDDTARGSNTVEDSRRVDADLTSDDRQSASYL